MATETIPFTGFADGEYGTLSPFTVGFAVYRQRLLYKGWWTGQNMVRGLDGTLFPRAGEKPYILTGVPNGVVEGMGFGIGTTFPYIWFAVADKVYRFRTDVYTTQAVDTYTGSIGAFTEPLAWVDHGQLSYLFAYPNGQYKLDHVAVTAAAVAGSPAAFNCTIYGDRLMAGSSSTLYYSAAADFETWPVDGNLQVGDILNIRSLDTVRGRLAIGKGGFLGEPWFMFQGVPGFNDVLRLAEVSMTAPHHEASVDMGQGIGLITADEGTLAVFDGSHLHPVPHLQVTSSTARGTPAEVSAFRLRRPGEWGVVTDKSVDAHDTTAGSIWLFRNGAWSRHRRTVPSTGAVAGAYCASIPVQSQVVFAQGGDVSHPATFSSWDPYLDRPPFTSDAATIIDPSLCFFSLPEWWARDGSDVAVQAVLVDFLSWNTGSSDPNTFTVDAVAMRTYDPSSDLSGSGGGDHTTASTRTYSEAGAGLSTSGTRRRRIFKYNEHWGNGFRLDVSGVRGVSIQKIVAVVETKAALI